MVTIPAANIRHIKPDELWDILDGPFIIEFDNGEQLETNHAETIWSSYLWQMLRDNPEVPLRKEHHLTHYLSKGYFNARIERTLLNAVYWDTQDYGNLREHPEFRDRMMRRMMESNNALYNAMVVRIEEYATTISGEDFIQFMDDPHLQDMMAKVEDSPTAIRAFYGEAINYVTSAPHFANNALVECMRDGTASAKQILQSVTIRGYISDVNGTIFKTPIRSNYFGGLIRPGDHLSESRSAIKALYYMQAPLQNTEYQSRRSQLPALSIETLHKGDCGSQRYLRFHVFPARETIPGVSTAHPGALRNLIGKYYLDEETNSLKVISAADTHLVGKYVMLRESMYCNHPDPHGVCEVCFGKLSEHVLPGDNIGHYCVVTFNRESVQLTLSVKHYDENSIPDGIVLDSTTKDLFTIGADTTSYILNDTEAVRNGTLIIPGYEANNLADLGVVMRAEDLDVINLTKIKRPEIITYHGNTPRSQHVNLGSARKTAYLTVELLVYMKETNDYVIDGKGNFHINLKNWNFDKPIFRLPAKEYSFASHSVDTNALIESSGKFLESRHTPGSPATMMTELFDLVNSKLNINMSVLGVIVYTFMVKNRDTVALSRGSPEPVLSIGPLVIGGRSLSGAMAHERQPQTLSKPSAYLAKDRPDSPFDVVICPKEVIDHYCGPPELYQQQFRH